MTGPGRRLDLYAGAELGAYGYDEKPWFRPHVRLDAFLAELRARGLREHVTLRHPGPASDEDLLLFHTPAHLEHVRRRSATNEGALDDGPTPARAAVERAATYVVGAVLDATRRILGGEASHGAFVPIAGFHHARREEARMYCLYNDPVIALTHALAHLDGNLAYVDVDVHQGDGVYEAFAGEPRVRIVDLHEDPSTLFPHAPDDRGEGSFPGRRDADGRGAAAGTKLNLPLEPFTGDDAYLALWDEAEAFLHAARPRFIVFASGVDGLRGDPLGHQCLTPHAIHVVTCRVRALAEAHAQGRLLVLGGGGYDLDNVSRGWATVVEALVAD